jgi:TfoX/Sxy family transcriptional regulator of competence genes
MANATPEGIGELDRLLNESIDGLPDVTARRMFGCHAVFAAGNVFGLVWKEGRIGVRLPDEGHYSRLLSTPGADPWRAGKMTMAHWVLAPAAMHGDRAQLKAWLAIGHALAKTAGPKAKRAKKTASPRKKPAARRKATPKSPAGTRGKRR